MTTINLAKGHSISLYNSIFELPIKLFTEFQKYMIQDMGIGSNLSDLNTRFEKLDMLLVAGKIKEAIDERTNMHMGIYYALEKINVKHYSFGCLIHAVDGREVTDFTESGIKDTLEMIGDLITEADLRSYLDQVKKNSIEN